MSRSVTEVSALDKVIHHHIKDYGCFVRHFICVYSLRDKASHQELPKTRMRV